jgi:hypothetical protein
MSARNVKPAVSKRRSVTASKDTGSRYSVWVAFDIALGGDYDGLFEWLDEYDAKECGDNLAFLQFDCFGDVIQALKKSLEEAVDFKDRDRVYVITKKPDGGYRGKFIIGRRRRAPWLGASLFDSFDDDG